MNDQNFTDHQFDTDSPRRGVHDMDGSYVREWDLTVESDGGFDDIYDAKIIARLPDLGTYKTVGDEADPAGVTRTNYLVICVKNVKERLITIKKYSGGLSASGKKLLSSDRNRAILKSLLIVALVLAVFGGYRLHRKSKKRARQAAQVAAKAESAKPIPAPVAEKKPEPAATPAKAPAPAPAAVAEKKPEPAATPAKAPAPAPAAVAEKKPEPAATPAKAPAPAAVAEKKPEPAATPAKAPAPAPAAVAEKKPEPAATPAKAPAPAPAAIAEKKPAPAAPPTTVAAEKKPAAAVVSPASPWDRSTTDGYTPWSMSSPSRLEAAVSNQEVTQTVPQATPQDVPGFSTTPPAAPMQGTPSNVAQSTPMMPMNNLSAGPMAAPVPQNYAPAYARSPYPATVQGPPAAMPPSQMPQGYYASQEIPMPQQAPAAGYYGGQYPPAPAAGYTMTPPQYVQRPYTGPSQVPVAMPPQGAAPYPPTTVVGQPPIPYQGQLYQGQPYQGQPQQTGVQQPVYQPQPQVAYQLSEQAQGTGTVYPQGNVQRQGTVYSQGQAYQKSLAPTGMPGLY